MSKSTSKKISAKVKSKKAKKTAIFGTQSDNSKRGGGAADKNRSSAQSGGTNKTAKQSNVKQNKNANQSGGTASGENQSENKNQSSGNSSGSAGLAEQIKSKFNKDNKIENTTITIEDSEVNIFYVESLIDKALFSNGILSCLQRLSRSRLETSEAGGEQSGNRKNNAAGSEPNDKTSSEANSQSNNSSSTSEQSSNSSGGAANGNAGSGGQSGNTLLDQIKTEIVTISGVTEASDANECLSKILSGNAVVVVQGEALCYPIFGASSRAVTEPPTSRVVKGPREGFVEDISKNIGLVRKRIKTETLKIEDIFVGERTATQISLIYIDGVAQPEVLAEIKKRIKKIDIDAIIDSYYIESFLEEGKIKFFRRVGNTEKPDIFCAKILEGRIGILVDGSPVALTAPFILFEDLQSAEDYYTIPAMASFTRIMRIMGLILAILIPGVYVALQSFNYRILPINFLITLLSSIEGLSLPPLLEILVVLLLFEIITEASLQMPSSLGMALSIIGALALGNTAVDAGLISPPSIVVVAISSVALYIIPDQINETRLLRILFTVVGGIMGLYGVLVSFLLLTTYLTYITSFGVPYLVPYAPSVKDDKQDGFIKQPISNMTRRPLLMSGKDKQRQEGETDDV